MTTQPLLKLVTWVGTSLEDLREFPEPVQDRVGDALFVAQQGGNHEATRQYTGGHNVFKDIGLPSPEEHLVKAQLVFKIDAIMKQRGMKQVQAAGVFGVRQPDISKMLRGGFRQLSVERLLRFLVALNQDVDIVVRPHSDDNSAPALHVF
jgi:predicted XRE-type DNA-binding protein